MKPHNGLLQDARLLSAVMGSNPSINRWSLIQGWKSQLEAVSGPEQGGQYIYPLVKPVLKELFQTIG